jgi:hypothetical protein
MHHQLLHIEAFRGNHHSLLAQTPRDLFHSLVTRVGSIGVAVHLILFAHHTPDCAPLFLCSEADKKKCCKGSQILLDVREPHQPWHESKTPCWGDGKRVLQRGVKEQDAADAGVPGGRKNQGIGCPPPSQGSGRGRDGPVDSFDPPEHDESHSRNDYSRCSPCFG